MMEIIMSLACEKGRKTWVALIGGRDATFVFAREFVRAIGGKPKGTGNADYILRDGGLYEVCELDERRFVQVENGEPNLVNRHTVLELTAAMEERKRKAAGEVDAAIVRFNAEGAWEPSEN